MPEELNQCPHDKIVVCKMNKGCLESRCNTFVEWLIKKRDELLKVLA